MVVITGASGHLGRQVVAELLKRMPAAEIAVSVRNPNKVADLADKGVRVAQGDFGDAKAMREAFDGAEQVLLVSANVLGDEAIRLHGNAIQAAKDAGVKRVLYTSHQAASAASRVAFARDHAATEALLQESGLAFVSLRQGFYAESALYQLGGMQATGTLALPADGPVSWTARADLAIVDAAAIADTGLFDGVTPALTASEAVRFEDVARFASEILGREIARVELSEAAYREQMAAQGMPAGVVDLLASLFGATRAGEFNVVDPTLERVLGRKPTPVQAVLRKFLMGADAV